MLNDDNNNHHHHHENEHQIKDHLDGSHEVKNHQDKIVVIFLNFRVIVKQTNYLQACSDPYKEEGIRCY